MNRYTFCFTKKELKEFSIRAVLEQYRRRGRVWVILLLLCVLEAFISPAFSVVILFLFAAALGVDMFRTCRFLEKEHFLEKRILWEEQNHTNTATTPFLEKEDYTTGKTTRIHSEKSRRLKRTAALETKDPNSYIPIYSPKRLGRMGRQQGERTHYPNVSST